MSGTFRPILLAATLTALSACSSSPPIGDLPSVAKELPPDLRARFEVSERGARPTPSPSTIPVAKKASKRKKVAQAERSVPPPPPPFVYPDRRPKVNPIWVGERQIIEINYIGLKAGQFTLDVLPMKTIADRTVYHLRALAESSNVMNLFTRINDSIDSFWDAEGLFSHRFHMIVDHTKQKRDALELFDSEKKKDFYWNRVNHIEKGISESKDSLDMEHPFSQDSFSALYYLRTLPLEDGKVYTYPVVSEGRCWDIVVTVIRREMVDTPLGKKRCIVVRPQTSFNGVLKQEKGETFIWLTDDDRRFIARLEAEVKVGALSGRLTQVEPGERPNAE